MSDSYDVIVIGGGPAGCTTATVLAQHGRKVLLLEKEPFPRYHVGESLMPFCYFTLERLGMIEAMEDKQFTHKHSVGFVTPDGRASRPFFFFQHYDHPSAQTWQVERQEFDQMLFENARKHGVDVRDGVKVKNVLRDDNGTVIGVATEDTHYHAKVTVDATGRDALTPNKKWLAPPRSRTQQNCRLDLFQRRKTRSRSRSRFYHCCLSTRERLVLVYPT